VHGFNKDECAMGLQMYYMLTDEICYMEAEEDLSTDEDENLILKDVCSVKGTRMFRKVMPHNLLYKSGYRYLGKTKTVNCFNFIGYLCTVVSPHNYLCAVHTFASIQAVL
jgi:hypothetical protein